MLRNFLLFLGAFSLAFVILTVSIFRIAEIRYVFSASPTPAPIFIGKQVKVNYPLPRPDAVLEDSVLWPLVAIKDKIWVTLTLNPQKKSDLYLFLADKRLADAKVLFGEGKPDLGISVLTKSEKYLQSADDEEKIAEANGMNTKEFLQKYVMATLKHRAVLDEILAIAPEDARPLVVKIENYPKFLYGEARNGLLQAGAETPQNPYQEN